MWVNPLLTILIINDNMTAYFDDFRRTSSTYIMSMLMRNSEDSTPTNNPNRILYVFKCKTYISKTTLVNHYKEIVV